MRFGEFIYSIFLFSVEVVTSTCFGEIVGGWFPVSGLQVYRVGGWVGGWVGGRSCWLRVARFDSR